MHKETYIAATISKTHKMPHTKSDKRNHGAYLLPCHWKAVAAAAP
jgi:hypothetical protein